MGDSLKRGLVVLAIYPFTDLSSAKRRPALVVSATGRPGRDYILAFITSRTSQIEATESYWLFWGHRRPWTGAGLYPLNRTPELRAQIRCSL